MSFLNNLIKDPKYQTTDPRQPEEITEADIISPDTRRENRMPPGQSRTKKWPVLDAHGTPEIDLATWSFEVDGLVERPQKWSLDEFMQLPAVSTLTFIVSPAGRVSTTSGAVCPRASLQRSLASNPKRSLYWRLPTTMAGPQTFPSNISSTRIRSSHGRMTARQSHPNTAGRSV